MQLPVNLRDLGGIPGRGGKTICTGRLLRSGEPVGLTQEDKDRLLAMQLRMIIDLRSAYELERRPIEALPGVQYHNIDILAQALVSDTESMIQDSGAMDAFMLRTYELLIRDEEARLGYARMLELLLHLEEGAALFHCQAGKDRTGVAAAIILTILGAREEDIFEDYLLTNMLRKEANHAVLDTLRQQGADEKRIKAFDTAMTVKQVYLQTAFDTAAKDYGSFAGYIEHALGMDEEKQSRLCALYLIAQ